MALLVLAGCASTSPSHSAASPSVVAGSTTIRPRPAATTSSPSPPALPDVPVVDAGVQLPGSGVRPVRVRIASQAITVPVVPVGVLADGGMQLPDRPTTAGWYRWGATPGSGAGSTLIAAHVDTVRYGLGPFSRLRYLRAGARVEVTTADGAVRRYAVTKVQYVGQQRLPREQLFGRDGPARLTLVTCGGSFDAATHRYSDNVIVSARPAA